MVGGAASGQRTLRIWDPAIRIFHWSLVTAVGIDLLLEAGTGLHAVAGYAVLALITFRFVWGFVGSRHARFANFIAGPGAVGRYLRSLRSSRPERISATIPPGR